MSLRAQAFSHSLGQGWRRWALQQIDPVYCRSADAVRKAARDPQRKQCAIHRRDRSHKIGEEFSGSPRAGVAAISRAIFLSYVVEIRTVISLIPLPLCRNPPMRPEQAFLLNPNTSREGVSRRGVVRYRRSEAAAISPRRCHRINPPYHPAGPEGTISP
jgi:hypothetical protein